MTLTEQPFPHASLIVIVAIVAALALGLQDGLFHLLLGAHIVVHGAVQRLFERVALLRVENLVVLVRVERSPATEVWKEYTESKIECNMAVNVAQTSMGWRKYTKNHNHTQRLKYRTMK